MSRIQKFLGLLFLALFAGALALSSCGKPMSAEDEADEQAGLNNPYPNFRGNEVRGEKNFAVLINNHATGKAEPTPWAGFWWPYTSNGIASGAYGGGASPAGKYDAARGGATQSQSWEMAVHGPKVKGVQGWWGHCNGWTASAALFPEPREDAMVNGIRFHVSDIKALLSEAGMSASADFFGNRVDWGQDYNNNKFHDTVPDQFFLVLTNYMGKLKQGVLLDRFTGHEVWNQPMAGYRFEYPKPSDYLGADPQAPSVYRIQLTTTIWWARDDVPPGVLTGPFDFQPVDDEHFQSRTLRLELWVDAPIVFGADGKVQSSGNVIVTRQGDYHVGGVWKEGDGWPDYLWVPYSIVKTTEQDQDFVNPYIDIDWIKKHLLVPGGADDPTASPRPIQPAPSSGPSARPSGQPSTLPSGAPIPTPTPLPTTTIRPTPTSTFTPIPMPTPPGPTSTVTPIPMPTRPPVVPVPPAPGPAPVPPAPAPTATFTPLPPITP